MNNDECCSITLFYNDMHKCQGLEILHILHSYHIVWDLHYKVVLVGTRIHLLYTHPYIDIYILQLVNYIHMKLYSTK